MSPCRAFITVEGITRSCDRPMGHQGKHKCWTWGTGVATRTADVEVRLTWAQS